MCLFFNFYPICPATLGLPLLLVSVLSSGGRWQRREKEGIARGGAGEEAMFLKFSERGVEETRTLLLSYTTSILKLTPSDSIAVLLLASAR